MLKVKASKLTLLLIGSLFFTLVALGQNIPSDLSQVRVDDLSDAQVEQFLKRVEDSGLSQQQLEVMARTRGMSATEISKLRARISQLQSKSTATPTEDIQRLREEDIIQQNEDLSLFEEFLIDSTSYSTGDKIFGMDLFKLKELTFEPNVNIPTPENYQLGSGDEVIIDIWGASEQTYQLKVSPEGSIRVPNLGPIYVNGLTIATARARIKSRLTRIYAGLAGSSPNTFSEVSLGNLRSIKVNVIGEVQRPGTYTLSSLATVFNALYYSGGPTENGSLRKIEVFRQGEKLVELDVYQYLIGGEDDNNVRLRDEDIISVSPYQKRVTVEGELKRTGIFESKGEETLATFLEFTGGFNEFAFKDLLTVRRNENREKSIKTVRKEQYSTFKLQDGDQIEVGKIIERYSNRVQIAGAVYRPGEYELEQGLTLKQLIGVAEGLRGDAFMGRGLILRTQDNLSLQTIEFDVNRIMDGAREIALVKDDYVIINSVYDLKEDQFVRIDGEVIRPGKFPYSSQMTIEDLIYLSGGLNESATGSNVEVARRKDSENPNLALSSEVFTFSVQRDLQLDAEASTFMLEPFDLVLVRKSPGYEEQSLIEIEGEVLYPGKYSIARKNERISDLLKRAGGLTNYAYIQGATLIRRTEFYSDENETDEAARIRRESLVELGRRDSTVTSIEIKTQESIGIRLGEILKAPGSKYDLILHEGDVISIPKELQTVRLRGELLYPSTVRYDDFNSFKDYISQAGGFSDYAKAGKAYIVYANGSAARTKRFLWFKKFPKVEPGAEIIVPKRPDKKHVSLQEILAITTSLTTIALLIQQLRN